MRHQQRAKDTRSEAIPSGKRTRQRCLRATRQHPACPGIWTRRQLGTALAGRRLGASLPAPSLEAAGRGLLLVVQVE